MAAVPLKVGFTGGASAGHVVPALAVAAQLRRMGVTDLVYFGRPSSIEEELAERAGLRFVPVAAAGLRRYRSVRNLKMPFSVVKGIFQAYGAMRRERPDLVFSKGSYVAVPTGIAAWLLRIPMAVQESDHSLGLANRILAPLARTVLLSSPGTAVSRRIARKAVVTGLPVRDDLIDGNPQRLRDRLHIAENERVLLIFCGSSGSVRINQAVRGQLPRLLERFTIVHVAGPGNLDESLTSEARYHQFEYLHDDMVDALWLADLVVGRAGATTLAELSALGKPAVVVPLPTSVSRGDQLDNAHAFAQGEDRLIVLDDADLPATLPDACLRLADRLGSNVRPLTDSATVRSAADNIARQLIGLAPKHP